MIAKQIQAVETQRGALITRMETLVNAAEETARALTTEEQTEFDGIRTQIGDCDARLRNLRETESLVATRALPVQPHETDEETRAPAAHTSRKSSKGPALLRGGFLARAAICKYHAEKGSMSAIDAAEYVLRDPEFAAILRAAQSAADTKTTGWAAELIQQQQQDFIELLRPRSVYARIQAAVTVNFAETNSIRIPRQTTGTPGAFVGEGGAIPVKQGAFDSVVLSPKKMGVITAVTEELLARSTPSVETILRDSMLQDTAIVLDRQFLSAVAGVTNVSPSGLFHTDNAPAPITPSANVDLAAAAQEDINAIMAAMYTGEVPLTNPVWLMHPLTELKLMSFKSATGAYYWREELLGGTLNKFPVMTTTLMDVALNGGGASDIDDLALVDQSQLAKGMGMGPEISLSREATVHMESAPATDIGGAATPVSSFWQRQMVGLRLTAEAEWKTRHKVGVQWITDIKW